MDNNDQFPPETFPINVSAGRLMLFVLQILEQCLINVVYAVHHTMYTLYYNECRLYIVDLTDRNSLIVRRFRMRL